MLTGNFGGCFGRYQMNQNNLSGIFWNSNVLQVLPWIFFWKIWNWYQEKDNAHCYWQIMVWDKGYRQEKKSCFKLCHEFCFWKVSSWYSENGSNCIWQIIWGKNMKWNSSCSMITGSSVELQTKPISNVTAGLAWKYPQNLKMFENKYFINLKYKFGFLGWFYFKHWDVISKWQI